MEFSWIFFYTLFMKIYVDADSCPVPVREVILKAAKRNDIPAVFVANREIPGLWGNAVMEVCRAEDGAADNRIVELTVKGDLVITRDIPLARRLVEKTIAVMDDRGRIFTSENIGEYYSMRCFQLGIIENGVTIVRTANYSKKNLKSFATAVNHCLC